MWAMAIVGLGMLVANGVKQVIVDNKTKDQAADLLGNSQAEFDAMGPLFSSMPSFTAHIPAPSAEAEDAADGSGESLEKEMKNFVV